MEELLRHFFVQVHWSVLAISIAISLYVLGKGADWLVDQAVTLSSRSGISKTVIGATVVSVGTTTPEVAVSVIAAIHGNPDLALGNAVGSIICDTGLILGLACLISPLRLDRSVVNRQGWVQLGAAFALVLACVPWSDLAAAPVTGGTMPQWMGFVFLGGLAWYLWQSVRWARKGGEAPGEPVEEDSGEATWRILLKLAGALGIVIVSAQTLIPAVEEAARRLSIPDSIIAATLVAFGTSLPELVTAVTAARRGHGELAVGNVIGADILNVLSVAAAAAAVTPGGLSADPYFFQMIFPTMIFVLVVFRIGVVASGDHLRRPFGFVLLGAYALVTVISYLFPGGDMQ